MTRQELEHVIRAAGSIANIDELVVGSQSVSGRFPDALSTRESPNYINGAVPARAVFPALSAEVAGPGVSCN
jgi:hypothetical protein